MTKINMINFKNACKDSYGVITLIAQRLTVFRSTIYKYMDKHPKAKEVYDEEKAKVKDLLQSKFIKAVNRDSPWAIALGLKTLCKDEGFTERTEVEHSGSTDNHIIFEVRNYTKNAKKDNTEPEQQTGGSLESSD